MADKPIRLRRAGTPAKKAEVTPDAPAGVPVAKRASEVACAVEDGKISTSTLPIYTLRPLHRFH